MSHTFIKVGACSLFFLALFSEQAPQNFPKKKSTENRNAPTDKVDVTKNKTPQETLVASKTRTITVKHKISQSMIGKNYLGVTYTPQFGVDINGKPLKFEEKQKVSISDNTLKVNYHFNFMHGIRKGSRQVLYRVPEDISECTLEFSWEDDQRILIPNATFCHCTVLD